jgi:nucleoside-diphosphate kinase
MLGETQPLASKPGSIRGDFSIDLGRNICKSEFWWIKHLLVQIRHRTYLGSLYPIDAGHGSDSPESAEHELKMWFPEGVNDYGKSVDSWVYE